MYSPTDDAALPAPGFPIRKSAGQRLFSASPRLIAAVHVLHLLLVPRHPPYALTILTVSRPEPEKRSGRLVSFQLIQYESLLQFNIGHCAVFKLHRGTRSGGFPEAVSQN